MSEQEQAEALLEWVRGKLSYPDIEILERIVADEYPVNEWPDILWDEEMEVSTWNEDTAILTRLCTEFADQLT